MDTTMRDEARGRSIVPNGPGAVPGGCYHIETEDPEPDALLEELIDHTPAREPEQWLGWVARSNRATSLEFLKEKGCLIDE